MELNLRLAVRALMIDPADRVLMVRLDFLDWTGWVLPGGGLEPGEDHITALHRELAEETGVPEVFVGPAVWHRRYVRTSPISGYDGQEEIVFLVPCRSFEVAPGMTAAQLRAEGVVEHRWWTVGELAAAEEAVHPIELSQLVAQILEHGAPSTPILLEVDNRQ